MFLILLRSSLSLSTKTVTATSKKKRRRIKIMANHPLPRGLLILAGFAFAMTPARGSITQIIMTTWSSNDCGGYGARVRVVNPGGETCLTSEKDFSKGEELVWEPQDGLDRDDCASMEITTDSAVYIETDHRNDFCPEFVFIKTPDGMYVTPKISDWYDYQSNNKKHKITPGACRSSNDCAEDHVCIGKYNSWHNSWHNECTTVKQALDALIKKENSLSIRANSSSSLFLFSSLSWLLPRSLGGSDQKRGRERG